MRSRIELLVVAPVLFLNPTMHVSASSDLAFELLLTVSELDLSFPKDEVADAFDIRVEKFRFVEIEGEVRTSLE